MHQILFKLSLVIIVLIGCFHHTFAQDSLQYIYNKHLEALGGIENINKVTSIKRIIIKTPNTSSTYPLKNKLVIYSFDNLYEREESYSISPTGKETITGIICKFNSNILRIWLASHGVFAPDKQSDTTFRFPKLDIQPPKKHLFNSLIAYKQNNYEAKYLGRELVNGIDCFKIKVIGENNLSSYYLIDTKTFLLISEYTQNSSLQEVTKKTYTNYKNIAGVLFPFTVTIYLPSETQTYNYEHIAINTPFNPQYNINCCPINR